MVYVPAAIPVFTLGRFHDCEFALEPEAPLSDQVGVIAFCALAVTVILDESVITSLSDNALICCVCSFSSSSIVSKFSFNTVISGGESVNSGLRRL